MGRPIPLDKPRETCRRWRLQVSLGRDKLTNTYPKVSERFNGTERQAERAQIEFERRVREGGVGPSDKTAFRAYAESWLEKRSRHVRKGTLRKERNNVRNLCLHMGDARMCDIDEDMVCLVMDKLATEGGASGAPLSGATCRGTFVTLGLIMAEAKRERVVAENPCKEIEARRRPKCDTKEKGSLTLDEARMLQALLMEGEPDSHRAGLMLALNCGLSREEFTGLRWCDVDFASKCIRVQNANTADDDGLMATKNDFRQRIIPLDDAVASRLFEWKILQTDKLAQKGICVNKHTPVVSNPVGEFVHPEAFGKWWRRCRVKIGLNGYGLHQLRHTYATILCASGTDIITAARLMGHCDTTMLSRVYAHVIPEYARQAASRVGSVLGGESGIAPVPFVIG